MSAPVERPDRRRGAGCARSAEREHAPGATRREGASGVRAMCPGWASVASLLAALPLLALLGSHLLSEGRLDLALGLFVMAAVLGCGPYLLGMVTP